MVRDAAYDLDRIFQALSDPTRRALLQRLHDRECPVTDLARPHDMSLAAVSKHIKVLERARLVCRRRAGSFSFVSLNGRAIESADRWIQQYRLDTLQNFLEKEKPRHERDQAE